jgi:predicted protein tyrosine phosphatase
MQSASVDVTHDDDLPMQQDQFFWIMMIVMVAMQKAVKGQSHKIYMT